MVIFDNVILKKNHNVNKMKYLLFISFNNGLKHNAVYENPVILHESINQLIEEEKLILKKEKIPSFSELEDHFRKEEDFYHELSNGTWFHIHELSERNYIRDEIRQEISV